MQNINEIRITGRRQFDVEMLRRIPVMVSDAAQAFIDGTTQQGRLFPLALSEHFGGHDAIKEVHLEIVKKSDVFALATGEDDSAQMLRITIKHLDETIEDGIKIINADDLHSIHPSGILGFNAALTAQELLRLHRIERGI